MTLTWNVHHPGNPLRVVVTKLLPGDRWLSILGAAGCEVHVSDARQTHTSAEIREAIGPRCHGVIGQLTEPWDAALFDALRQAGGKVYSNYAVGFDNVKVADATARGIAVGNTPGVLTETTAEMAVALTLAAARRIPEAESYLRSGRFQGWLPDLFLGKRLHGGTLGLIGAGRIGSAYAKMLAVAHRMNVMYLSRSRNRELEKFFDRLCAAVGADCGRSIACYRAESLEDLLEHSDVVSLHVPLTAETRHLINRDRLNLMKPDAILVNTSRGAVVDEAALVEHLRTHPEFRAGLDVFEREPLLAPGLAELPNVVAVPHIASATVWTRAGMASLAAANVAGVLKGYPVAKRLQVSEYLEGDIPRTTPSILNARELGLAEG